MLPGYSQQRTINIAATGIAGGQLRVDIHAGNADWAAILTNGGDIRFTTIADSVLPIWVERFDYVQKCAMVWVKLPDPQPAAILLQYGNPAAATVSDYAATMRKKHTDGNTIAAYHFEAQSGASESGAFPATVTGVTWATTDAGNMANYFVDGGANFISFAGNHPVFDGTTGKNISIPGLLDSFGSAFSISFWMKPANTRPRTGVTAGMRLFCKVNSLGPDNFIEAYFNDATSGTDNGRIVVRMAVGGTVHIVQSRRLGFRSERWYNIVVDGGALGLRIAVNGMPEHEKAGITAVPATGSNDAFRFGCGYQNSNNFSGALGCLSVENRQMPASEIHARFQRRKYFPVTTQADRWVRGGQVFGDTAGRPQAGEPSAIVVGGTVHAYFAEAVTDATQIMQSYSSSTNGTTWAASQVIVPSGDGNPLRNTIYTENGIYYLYCPISVTGGKDIFVWTGSSPSGPFTKQTAAALIHDSDFVFIENPDLKKIGGTYMMIIDGSGGGALNANFPLRVATSNSPLGPFAFLSTDKMKSLKPTPFGEGHAVWRLPATGGGWHMWYHQEEDGVLPGNTYYARSYSQTDYDNYFPSVFGAVRTIRNDNILIDQWSDVSVFEFSGNTYMLRSEANNADPVIVTARVQQDSYGGNIDALVAETHYSFAPANQAKFIFSNGRPIFTNGKLVTLWN